MAETWMTVSLGNLEGSWQFSGQPDCANLAFLGRPWGQAEQRSAMDTHLHQQPVDLLCEFLNAGVRSLLLWDRGGCKHVLIQRASA